MIRVTSTKGTRGTKGLNVVQFLDATNRQKLNTAAAKLVEREVQRKVKQHYTNAVQMVGAALAGVGMPSSITTNGPKRVGYLKAEGGSGYVNTSSWKQLSNKYLDPDARPTWWNKKVAGTPFWMNTGGLADAYLDKVIGGPISVSKGRTTIKPASRKDRFRMETVWRLGKLGDPYADALIRGPFATGDKSSQGSLVMDPSGDMWKMWINEKGRWGAPGSPFMEGRPWVADMAATLGKQMRTTVRKIA